MDRIRMGRPVLIPGHGGWLRQFGHVEDLADAMVAMLGNPRDVRPGLQRDGRRRHHPDRASSSSSPRSWAARSTVRHFDAAVLKAVRQARPGVRPEPRLRVPRRAHDAEAPPGARHLALATRWPRASDRRGSGTAPPGSTGDLSTRASRTRSSRRSGRERGDARGGRPVRRPPRNILVYCPSAADARAYADLIRLPRRAFAVHAAASRD